jgi:hypothetical protein
MSGSNLVDSIGAIRDASKSPAGFYSRNAAWIFIKLAGSGPEGRVLPQKSPRNSVN